MADIAKQRGIAGDPRHATAAGSAALDLALPDTAATEAFGARLAHALDDPALLSGSGCSVWLNGDLGAGKTTLARALIRAMGHAGRVRSPTYTLVEPYRLRARDGSGLDLYHFDLYRFGDPAEWYEAGFDEYLAAPGLRLIEWPEKAGACLPTPDLTIDLALDGDSRTLHARAHTQKGTLCLERC